MYSTAGKCKPLRRKTKHKQEAAPQVNASRLGEKLNTNKAAAPQVNAAA